jgi:hypothetical protein
MDLYFAFYTNELQRFLLAIGRIAPIKFCIQYNGEAYAILVKLESRFFDYWNNACYIIHSHSKLKILL